MRRVFCSLLANLPPVSAAGLASACFLLPSKTTHLPAVPCPGLVCSYCSLRGLQLVLLGWFHHSSMCHQGKSGSRVSLLVELQLSRPGRFSFLSFYWCEKKIQWEEVSQAVNSLLTCAEVAQGCQGIFMEQCKRKRVC